MSEPTLADLLRDLSEKTTTLVRQEVLLAKTELQESLAGLGRGAALVAVGGAILYSAFVVLLGAGALALASVLGIAVWLSALVVAATVAIMGAVCLRVGWMRLRRTSIVPTATIASVKEDVTWLKDHAP